MIRASSTVANILPRMSSALDHMMALSWHMLSSVMKQFPYLYYLMALSVSIYSLGFFLGDGAKKVTSTVSGTLFLGICLFVILMQLSISQTKKSFQLLPHFMGTTFVATLLVVVASSVLIAIFAVRDYPNPLSLALAVMLTLIIFTLFTLIALRYFGVWIYVAIPLIIGDLFSGTLRLTNEAPQLLSILLILFIIPVTGWLCYHINAIKLLQRPNYPAVFTPLINHSRQWVSSIRPTRYNARVNERDTVFGLLTGLYKDSVLTKLAKLAFCYCALGVIFFAHNNAPDKLSFNTNFTAIILIFVPPITFAVMSLSGFGKLRALWIIGVGSRAHLWQTLLGKVSKLAIYGLLMLMVNTSIVSYLWAFSTADALSLFAGLTIATVWSAYLLCFLSLFPKRITALGRVFSLLLLTLVLVTGIVSLVHEHWMMAMFIFVVLGSASMFYMHRNIRHYVLYGDLLRSAFAHTLYATKS